MLSSLVSLAALDLILIIGAASFLLSRPLTFGVLNVFYSLTWFRDGFGNNKIETFDFTAISLHIESLVMNRIEFTLVAICHKVS